MFLLAEKSNFTPITFKNMDWNLAFGVTMGGGERTAASGRYGGAGDRRSLLNEFLRAV